MGGNNFTVYLGICVEDRQLKTRLLKCQLIELTPMLLGELADHGDIETFKFEDMLAKAEVEGKVKASNIIVADWFGLFSNRSYPPDVVKGEQLLVFRYGDSDKFHWISMGRDDNLRRGELLRIAISDDMSVVKKLNDDNTYFIELDTRVTKRLRLVTSKSDGESYRYNLTFDAKNDKVVLGDDGQNQFEIFSAIPRIRMFNRDGTTVDLNQEDLIMLAPNDMLLRAANTMTLQATTINILAETINQQGDAINIAGGDVSITGDDVSVSSNSMSMGGSGGAPGQVGITGILNIEGELRITGKILGTEAEFTGTVKADTFDGGGCT